MYDKVAGARECLQILRDSIKVAKADVAEAEKNYKQFCQFDDCGGSYEKDLIAAKAKLSALVQARIEIEKQSKRIGYRIKEKYSQDPFVDRENVKNRWREEYKKYGKLIIAYDFDYTVHSYKGEEYTYDYVMNLLRELRPYATYIVFSASPETRYDYIREYLDEHSIPYDEINKDVLPRTETRKIYYNVFLDDRAGLGEVVEILYELLDEIKSGNLKSE